MSHYDVAIVGSGLAGSILARILRRQGRCVVLVEKGRHPRFALGESTTPLANFALERLADHYDLPDLRHLSTWGRWRAHLPHLRRGLKRGFTFYHHDRGEAYRNSDANEARLLVAASPSDAIADTHWLRQDVDHHLVERAVAEGVVYFDETLLDDVELGSRVRLAGHRQGERLRLTADYLVDGSGPSGLLAGALPLASTVDRVPFASGLLFSHFDHLGDFVEIARHGGAVMDPGPYPDERAAVHHLLDDGWAYVLPFDHGTASAGFVLRDREALVGSDPAAAWQERLERYPSLAAQFAGARPLRPIRFVERIQHRLEQAAGERWFLLPHTYAFYDPLFSTGMAWSLLAVERLGLLFAGRHGDAPAYERQLAREADRIEQLIAAAYLAMDDFELFAAVAQLYFATVSFTEVRQRLVPESGEETPYAWQGFLGVGDPLLDGLFEEVLGRLREGDAGPGFGEWLAKRLAPRNIAGLADPERRNLYPVDLDVLVERCGLLGLSREEVMAALPRLRGDDAA